MGAGSIAGPEGEDRGRKHLGSGRRRREDASDWFDGFKGQKGVAAFCWELELGATFSLTAQDEETDLIRMQATRTEIEWIFCYARGGRFLGLTLFLFRSSGRQGNGLLLCNGIVF